MPNMQTTRQFVVFLQQCNFLPANQNSLVASSDKNYHHQRAALLLIFHRFFLLSVHFFLVSFGCMHVCFLVLLVETVGGVSSEGSPRSARKGMTSQTGRNGHASLPSSGAASSETKRTVELKSMLL